MGNFAKRPITALLAVMAFAIQCGAQGASPAVASPAFTPPASEVLKRLRLVGERHDFAVAMPIDNGAGKYLLHIKQRHSETTERGLLRVDPAILRSQSAIESLLRALRQDHLPNGAPLPVFLEGDIEPVPDFRQIREDIATLTRSARNDDELFRSLRDYYEARFLQRLATLTIPQLAEINFLIARALKGAGKHLDFLCVDGIAHGDASAEELALMAGAAFKLHALGEVMLMPAEGKTEIAGALALVYKEGRELFDALARAVREWAPAPEHAELLALLQRARRLHRYQWVTARLAPFAGAAERAALLKQFRARADYVTEAVFMTRERKAVEHVAAYLERSPAKLAYLVFGVDHDFTQAVADWNNNAGYRIGLITFTHNIEAANPGGDFMMPVRATHVPQCGAGRDRAKPIWPW